MTRRISIIEIDVSRCDNTYSIAPCTASIPATGDIKCFNCFATCQDKENYVKIIETLRFNKSTDALPDSIDSVPSIAKIGFVPGRIDLGKSIGQRSTLSIAFKDHRSPDTGPGGDLYLSDRDYDPYTRGSYFGKFRARYPFIEDGDLRWIQGTHDQPLSQMETRHFIISSFSGPDIKGNFSIKAKDVLRLIDFKKAQAPLASLGKLSANINDVVTSLTLSPVGIGDSNYPASGSASIGNAEMVTFARAADVITMVRGQHNTDAMEHSTDDVFQLALVYDPQDPALILNDLLNTYGNIPTAFIPLLTWQIETATFNPKLYGSVIAMPTPVTQLINELLEQMGASMWWSDLTRLINMRILRAVDSTATVYDSDSIMAGSANTTEQPDKRVSEVWTSFGQINPLEPLDEEKNYRSTLVTRADETELEYKSVSIRRIFSRWIAPFGGAIASTLNDLILSRYSRPPRLIGYRLLRDSGAFQPEMGGGYKILTDVIQDDTGAQIETDIQVISVNSDDSFHTVAAEEVLFSQTITPVDPDVRPIPIDSNSVNIDIRAIYDTLFQPPDADTVVNITIYEGVTVGSEQTLLPAIKTGSWPDGVILNLENMGRIQGKGGDGGDGGSATIFVFASYGPGFDGIKGGDALLVEYDINVDNLDGEIWSGGGGGGGGGSANSGSGGGGGGGQSNLDSIGGTPGLYNSSDTLENLLLSTGSPGGIGTSNSPGAGGEKVNWRYNGGFGGNGGGAGLPGAPGQTKTSPGGLGGATGDAIVQSGGTATIINAGDIKGAIV